MLGGGVQCWAETGKRSLTSGPQRRFEIKPVSGGLESGTVD